jgi:hypothetical protein
MNWNLYNTVWSNYNFDDYAKEYKYRQVILRDGVKIYDKIESMWSLNSEVASKVIKSWNCNYNLVGLQYIYCQL